MLKVGKRKIIVLALIGTLFFLCNHYFVFYFYDKGLEQAVREHAVGSRIFVGIEEEPYKQFYKREKPIRGYVPKKIINSINDIYLPMNVYKIKDIQDIKKFKNLEDFTLGSGGVGKKTGEKFALPQNINSLSTLERLEKVFFSDMNIMAEEFKDECKPVNQLILTRCFVDDYTFIEKFPNLKKLSIDGMEILSLEFGKRLNNLENLQLLDNQYQCSLESLAFFQNLKTLSVKSDDPAVFVEIPFLNTVRELTLNGAGAPDKDHVTQYLEWGNLERLDLNGGYYDVATKEWHEYEKQ